MNGRAEPWGSPACSQTEKTWMVGSFIYCCRYPDQGPPWSSQLGSIPCLAGLSRLWEICWSPTSRRNAPLRGSQRRHNHVSCFLLLLMLFIFGRKLILDSRKGSIICPTRRGWPPTLIDTVRRRLRFMGAICAG